MTTVERTIEPVGYSYFKDGRKLAVAIPRVPRAVTFWTRWEVDHRDFRSGQTRLFGTLKEAEAFIRGYSPLTEEA